MLREVGESSWVTPLRHRGAHAWRNGYSLLRACLFIMYERLHIYIIMCMHSFSLVTIQIRMGTTFLFFIFIISTFSSLS